ncbi:mechanosensitive ion channel family protein [Anabaena sp. CCY 0017]|uniref:mechanosensitive ion channel family protein n=1 Tax=Anabaena sp. CCY 0017 TaxID=3103866 RepID=UPI0039C6FD95
MMVSFIPKVNSRYYSRQFLAVIFLLSVLIVPTQKAISQEVSPIPVTSPSSETEDTPTTGLFFADILVRGRPVFQIGSLGELTATQRAQIINRRIASILVRSPTDKQVSVVTDSQRGIATLQLNNRVLMTVTQQDAEDFNLEVEALGQWWANQLNRAFDQPPLAIDVGQRLLSTLRTFQRETIDNLPSVLGMLLVVIMTGIIAAIMRHLTLTGAQHWEVDRNSKILVSRLVYGFIWVIGSIVALGVLGLDFATLLGTLGLTSVAIGFSLKDILSNYFSGIILLVSRSFHLGDQIVIKEFEGTVTQIQLRATTLKTYDGRVVYIPNQEVFSAIIINNTATTIRRNTIIVGINYNANIAKAKKVINDAVLEVPGIEKEPKPDVLVRELAASTVNIEVRCWVNSRRLTFLETTSLMAQAIKEALEAAQIDMPTDIYTLKFSDVLAVSDQK